MYKCTKCLTVSSKPQTRPRPTSLSLIQQSYYDKHNEHLHELELNQDVTYVLKHVSLHFYFLLSFDMKTFLLVVCCNAETNWMMRACFCRYVSETKQPTRRRVIHKINRRLLSKQWRFHTFFMRCWYLNAYRVPIATQKKLRANCRYFARARILLHIHQHNTHCWMGNQVSIQTSPNGDSTQAMRAWTCLGLHGSVTTVKGFNKRLAFKQIVSRDYWCTWLSIRVL